MNGTNLFKIALRALSNNKLRAFLTMLGIIIGVMAVIVIVGLGNGMTKRMRDSYSAQGNNKKNAFLSMLCIIICVASVITMLAIGQGSKKSIQAQISEMGSNMIMIHPGGERRGGVRMDPSEMQTLKLTA